MLAILPFEVIHDTESLTGVGAVGVGGNVDASVTATTVADCSVCVTTSSSSPCPQFFFVGCGLPEALFLPNIGLNCGHLGLPCSVDLQRRHSCLYVQLVELHPR